VGLGDFLESWKRRLRGDPDRDLGDEIQFHLEARIRDNLDSGMTASEAVREAERRFGSRKEVEAACRAIREESGAGRRFGSALFRGLRGDVRDTLRRLLREPLSTALVVATLALGVGATAAALAVLEGVLYRPLPFGEPERIVRIAENNLERGWAYFPVRYRSFDAWRSESRSFDAMAAADWIYVNLDGEPEPERVSGARVTCDYFRVMGVEPALGRSLTADDCSPGGEPILILGHGLWRRRYGGRPEIVGEAVRFDGETRRVVGVMPQAYDYEWIGWKDFWVPLQLSREVADADARHLYFVHARLGGDVAFEEARADVETISSRLTLEMPETHAGWGVTFRSLHDYVVEDVRPALLALFAGVGALFLVGSANVGNVLLARGLARFREVNLRAALGASRARIARQFFVDSLFLWLAGGALGLFVAQAALRFLVSVNAFEVPRLRDVSLGAVPALAALATTLLTGVVFGTFPALVASRVDLQSVLREAKHAESVAGRWTTRWLVTVQVALALVLLVCGSLLTFDLRSLLGKEPGFRVTGTLAVEVSLPERSFSDERARLRALRDIEGLLSSSPGVAEVSIAYAAPPGILAEGQIQVAGRALPTPGRELDCSWTKIGPGYFRHLGIPLLDGRDFTEAEGWDTASVALVTRTAAERYWPGESPLGARITFDDPRGEEPRWLTVVGVVEDVSEPGAATAPRAAAYLPLSHRTPRDVAILLRAEEGTEPEALASTVRDALARVAPGAPVVAARTLEGLLEDAVARPTFLAFLVSGFAGMAVVYVAVGLYAVLSRSVVRRTAEIGMRMALGASPPRVALEVVLSALRPVLLGILLGALVSIPAASALRALLIAGGAFPAGSLLVPIAAVGLTVVVGAAAPAARASRLSPLDALREG
jgi:predicted permease